MRVVPEMGVDFVCSLFVCAKSESKMSDSEESKKSPKCPRSGCVWREEEENLGGERQLYKDRRGHWKMESTMFDLRFPLLDGEDIVTYLHGVHSTESAQSWVTTYASLNRGGGIDR